MNALHRIKKIHEETLQKLTTLRERQVNLFETVTKRIDAEQIKAVLLDIDRLYDKRNRTEH